MPGKVKDPGKKAARQLNGARSVPKRLYETELYRDRKSVV